MFLAKKQKENDVTGSEWYRIEYHRVMRQIIIILHICQANNDFVFLIQIFFCFFTSIQFCFVCFLACLSACLSVFCLLACLSFNTQGILNHNKGRGIQVKYFIVVHALRFDIFNLFCFCIDKYNMIVHRLISCGQEQLAILKE